jgi:PAS domain S-box-containing protein
MMDDSPAGPEGGPPRSWLSAAEAQSLLAAIVESSDDAILSKTLEGTITSWNGGAERLFGYSAVEAIGRSIRLIIPPDRWDEEQAIVEAVRQGKRVEHFETVRVCRDGRLVDVSVTVAAVRDASGRIVGASSVKRDITARKRSETALRESESRFQTLATNAPAAIFIKNREGRYTLANPLACEALGWPEGAVGFTDHDLLPGDVADALRQADEEVLSTGRALAREERVRRPGFDRVYLSVKFPLAGSHGEPVGVCGVAIDITDRKRAEEALHEADRRKDEFLAVLAHELRNPLAPIRNSLHILRLADDVDPTLEKVREVLERQTDHLARLVDDLLEVSRITLGKIELRPEVVELAAIIRSAVETSRPLVDAGRHQLAISLAREPLRVNADPTRLAQVIANLLNNAAKYTPQGGQIWLSAEDDGERALIRVRDNGAGISREMLPRVFEKFAQVGRDEVRSQGGLGIGLALAASLVRLHDGQIEAHSAGLGRGSEFIIRLPLVAVPARHAGPARPRAASHAKVPPRRVLVVDDTRDSAFILGRLLEVLGHRVSTATSAMAALEAARRETPDVVISDIAMPDMDGYELAHQIRREAGLENTVLVALTGYGQESDRQRALEAGFDFHIVKPVSLEILQALFGSFAESRRTQAS